MFKWVADILVVCVTYHFFKDRFLTNIREYTLERSHFLFVNVIRVFLKEVTLSYIREYTLKRSHFPVVRVTSVFSQINDLNRHQQVHAEDKLFSCSLCNKSVNQK